MSKVELVTDSYILTDTLANFLVNPVNCMGVMGAGLALEFANRFPCGAYRQACQHDELEPGEILQEGRVIHAATKGHWRRPSTMAYVEGCLLRIGEFASEVEDTVYAPVVALPMLGCGLGGLDSGVVLSSIHKLLGGRRGNVLYRVYL